MITINEKDALKKSKHRFSGLREAIWARDNNQCVDCQMTQEQHIEKWKKRLTVNHINGIGRNAPIPDNRMENLETLCLVCHGKKDGPRWMLTSKT